MRSYKGIICGDISEFESYHPRQAVGVSTSYMRMPLKTARPDVGLGAAARVYARGGTPRWARSGDGA
jgi:hypothetical protein